MAACNCLARSIHGRGLTHQLVLESGERGARATQKLVGEFQHEGVEAPDASKRRPISRRRLTRTARGFGSRLAGMQRG